MRASLRFAPVLVCLGFAAAACGDDAGGEGGSGTGGDATASTGGPSSGTEATSSAGNGGGDATSTASGAGGDPAECDFPPSNATSPQIREFETVAGTVTTVDGEPVAADAVQVCGINLCLYGETDESGEVLVAQGPTPLDVPIFKAGDGLDRAKIGYPVPPGGGEIEISATTIDLVDSGTAMEAGAEADADGVVLTIADAGLVGLNILEFGDPGQDTFRAAVIPAAFIDLVAPDQGFVAVVGLGPHETIFCPPAGLSIPNDADLEPGTEVEFVQQGLETGQYFVDYGQWGQVATGHVSDDGATITTDDGQGIPIISAIGVRPL